MNTTTKNFQYNESQARSEVSLLPYAISMILFSALPHLVFAQEPPPGIERECGEHSVPVIHEGFLPHDGALPPLPRAMGMPHPPLPWYVDLTEEQQEMAFKLMQHQAVAIFDNEKIVRKSMRELHNLSMLEHFDADKARSLTEAHAKALAELAYLQTEFQAQVWAMLSKEQRKRATEQAEPPRR